MRLSFPLALAAPAALLGLAAVPAAATTRLVPQQYPTIQAAVTAARPGDTVQVSAKPRGGVYSEAVVVATPNLTLQGVGGPVLDGTAFNTAVVMYPGSPYSYVFYGGATGITIRASHVSVCGFTVQNFGPQEAQDLYGAPNPASAGISSGAASQTSAPSDISVSGCTLKNNFVGVSLNGGLYPAGGFSFYPTAFATGYRVLGCTATGNSSSGVSVTGGAVIVSGGAFTKNGGDGLDVFGEGLSVLGCELGANAGSGLNVDDYDTYNVPGSVPADDPAGPTTVALNAVHDNGYIGIEASGTVGLTGNAVAHNAVYGIDLSFNVDGSQVSGNVVSGTTVGAASYYNSDAGTGVLVSETTYDPGYVTVSFNQISGNAGDGIFFDEVSGSTIASNAVSGNGVVGIHLSDYTTYDAQTPNTVTQNVALHNGQFDAFDDSAAPSTDSVTEADGTQVYGDGTPTVNVWSHDVFGRTDPPGLGK